MPTLMSRQCGTFELFLFQISFVQIPNCQFSIENYFPLRYQLSGPRKDCVNKNPWERQDTFNLSLLFYRPSELRVENEGYFKPIFELLISYLNANFAAARFSFFPIFLSGPNPPYFVWPKKTWT